MKYGLLIAMLATFPAAAFGPATHAYILLQIKPDAPGPMVFGAMAADLNSFNGGDDKLGSCVKGLTHFHADLLAPSPFRFGMLTHNGSWGADSYAHAYFHIPTKKLYPMRVFEQLSQETGITMNQAEDLVEGTLDFVLCRDLGPAYVQRLIDAAKSVGATEEQAVVDAFAQPVTEKMGMPKESAERWLRIMFQTDQKTLQSTLSLLAMPEKTMKCAPVLLAGGLGIEDSRVEPCVKRAIELCADWRANIDKIAAEMAANPDLK